MDALIARIRFHQLEDNSERARQDELFQHTDVGVLAVCIVRVEPELAVECKRKSLDYPTSPGAVAECRIVHRLGRANLSKARMPRLHEKRAGKRRTLEGPPYAGVPLNVANHRRPVGSDVEGRLVGEVERKWRRVGKHGEKCLKVGVELEESLFGFCHAVGCLIDLAEHGDAVD